MQELVPIDLSTHPLLQKRYISDLVCEVVALECRPSIVATIFSWQQLYSLYQLITGVVHFVLFFSTSLGISVCIYF